MERIGELLAGGPRQQSASETDSTSENDDRIRYVELKMEALDTRLEVLEREHGIEPPSRKPRRE